jgi:hypothetical protein
MESCDYWNLLRSGEKSQIEQGLRQLNQAHTEKPYVHTIFELGVACLWLRDYETGWQNFRKSIDTGPTTTSSDFGMAGAAKWCLGEFKKAVDEWKPGLKAQYADANGLNLEIPLLLFLASVLKPEAFEKRLALEVLTKKARDRRIKEWPGPIVRLILGQIGESDFRNLCKGRDEPDTLDQHWLAEFYRGVLLFGEGKHSQFKETMRKLADTSRPEWSDENYFLSRVWTPEFFIARYEAEKT